MDRPATVLFGARAQRDLYALDALDRIAKQWKAPLTVVPILSDEPADSDWEGARGFVTAHMAAHLTDRTHAYLCGPPAMVDAALLPLRDAGVPAEHIHFDRFTTAADNPLASAEPGEVAGFWHYAKFCLFHALSLYVVFVVLAGGWWTTAGLLGLIAIYSLGDRFGGDDTSTPHYTRPGILTGLTWMALPLISLVTFCLLYTSDAADE